MGGAVAACAPPLPLVVLPPDGVSTLRYARGPVPPKRRAAAIIGFAPFPLPPPPLAQMASSAGGKSLRARCGVPLRPPVPAGRRRPWPAAGASSVVSRPCPVRAAVGRLRSRRPRPRRSARANKVGGLASAAFSRRAAAAARPSAPAPPPGFGPGAGLFCFRCGGFGDCAACGRR